MGGCQKLISELIVGGGANLGCPPKLPSCTRVHREEFFEKNQTNFKHKCNVFVFGFFFFGAGAGPSGWDQEV